MNDTTTEMRATLQAAAIRRAFADWLRADADKLVSAAQILGGDRWEDRATAVAEAMAGGAEPEEVRADLVALRRLLTLECTDEIDSLEAVRFLPVDPDDPRADDAQLCAEALEWGLGAMDQLATMTVREVA